MEEILLEAQLRNITGKAVRQFRRDGYVPGVVYGHHTDPIHLKVEERALRQALREAGLNQLITLTVEGIEEPKRVLVRELQRDAIRHAMLHVDFYEVIMTEKLTAEVPIVLVGQSPVVKGGNGLLFEGLDTIEIECLPGDLPPQVEVDISILTAIDQAVLVRDLNLGEGVDVLTQPDEIVVKILPPEKEEVEVAPPVEEVPEVEVVGKKKPEEEAPAAEAPPEEQSASATRQGKAQQERVVRTP